MTARQAATCQACDHPSQDAYLCRHCADRLARDLGDIPALVAELQVTITRQSRIGGDPIGVVSRSAEQPMPFNWAASDVAWALANVAGRWATAVAELRGITLDLANEHVPTPPRHRDYKQVAVPATLDRHGNPVPARYHDDPANPIQAARDKASRAARWLLRHIESIRQHPEAGELAEEVADAVRMARHAIDRPPDLWYSGPCDHCDADLYGLPHAVVIACRECGAEYDTVARREWLLDSAQHYLSHAALIARALPRLIDQHLTAAMIRGWAHRGRLLPHSVDALGRPLYRIGDVAEILIQESTKEAS